MEDGEVGRSNESLHVNQLEIGFPPDKNVGKKDSAKYIQIFAIISFLAAVALATALAVFVIRYNDVKASIEDTKESEDVCSTKGCALAAARVINSLDERIDPCDDMYQFACGAWIQKHVIPEDKSLVGTLNVVVDEAAVVLKNALEREPQVDELEAIRKVKHFYKSCVDEDSIEDAGISTIIPYLEEFGGWPVLGNNSGGGWNETTYRLIDVLVKTRRYTNSVANEDKGPLFNMFVITDDKNPDYNIIWLDQTDLGMPNRDYYLKQRNDSQLMAYQTFAESVARAFGADEQTARTDMEKMVDLEIELANITVPKDERLDPQKLYNKMKLGDLSRNFTGFDWLHYASRIFNFTHIMTAGIDPTVNGTDDTGSEMNPTINETEDIVVMSPPYLEKLFDVLDRHGHRTVANYVMWRLIKNALFYLPKHIRDIKAVYDKAITGASTSLPRWRSCSSVIKKEMLYVAGRIFVDEVFSDTAKRRVLDIVRKLRFAYEEMIQNADWMDAETKSYAVQKLQVMDPRMGYPDRIKDASWLNSLHDKLNIDPSKAFQNSLRVRQISSARELMILRKPVDKQRWYLSPADVNAYYDPTANQIVFLAAVLQPPLYSESQPNSLNYGGIGSVIGHEMTHGFDNYGRNYDKDGSLRDWWTLETAEKFTNKSKCLIEQYDNFAEAGLNLNGRLTLGENIADNGMIKESFMAYKKWIEANGPEPKLPGLKYSHEQLFFINAAQTWCGRYRPEEVLRRIKIDYHSIYKYRVLGPMQNYEEFAKVFNCRPGSRMNPEKKCSVW